MRASIFSGGALSNLSVFTGHYAIYHRIYYVSLLIKVIPPLEALARKVRPATANQPVYPAGGVADIYSMGDFHRKLLQTRILTGNFGDESRILVIYVADHHALSAGAMFVMWLGEQITEFGISNGASLIIMAIVARMPYAAGGCIAR